MGLGSLAVGCVLLNLQLALRVMAFRAAGVKTVVSRLYPKYGKVTYCSRLYCQAAGTMPCILCFGCFSSEHVAFGYGSITRTTHEEVAVVGSLLLFLPERVELDFQKRNGGEGVCQKDNASSGVDLLLSR